LSHASDHRVFNRDFCTVNSCNVKKMPFGEISIIPSLGIALTHKGITGNTSRVIRQKAFRPIGDLNISYEFG